MKSPTEKQINYANKIANRFNLTLPKEKTSYTYYHFINNYHEEYQKSLRNDWNTWDIDDPWSPYAVYDASDFC